MAVSVPRQRSAERGKSGPARVARARQDWRPNLFSRAVTGVVIALALLWLVPIAWALDTSVKAENDTIIVPATWNVPHFTFSAFSAVFSASDLGRWYINSAIVALAVTVLTVITASMAGYALSRRPVPRQGVLLRGDPGRDHDPAAGADRAAVPRVPGGAPDQHLLGADPAAGPRPDRGVHLQEVLRRRTDQLEQAAEVDGANWWTSYRRIALPLARPAIAAVAIFTFVWTWNNFLWPFLAATSQTMMTIPAGLGTVINGVGIINALQMASAMLGALPLVFVFLLAQRQIVQGVAGTGLK